MCSGYEKESRAGSRIRRCTIRLGPHLRTTIMRKTLSVLPVVVVAVLSFAVASAQDQQRPGRGRPSDGPGTPQDENGSRGQPERGRPTPNRPPDLSRPGGPAPSTRPPATRPPPGGPALVRPRPPHRFISQGRWRPSIRGPAFRYPPGFRYQLWATGAILPPIFLTAPYFYDQYTPLGLGPPPPGYRWIRYGPDLLLVNLVTGRVADVVDGVFY